MRLVAAYRWELWLLVGVPCIRLAGAPLVETFLDAYSGSPADADDAVSRLAAARAAASIAAFAAAALSYVRVRRQERELLPLVGAYIVASSALSAFDRLHFAMSSVAGGGVATGFDIAELPIWLGFWAVYAWLVWGALRFSLFHALFLVALGYFTAETELEIRVFFRYLTDDQAAARYMVILAAGATMAWLLRAFDSRAAEFRWKAVAALVIVGTAAHSTIGVNLYAPEYYWIESPADAARSLADALDGLIIAFALVLLIYAVRRVAKGIGAPRRGSA